MCSCPALLAHQGNQRKVNKWLKKNIPNLYHFKVASTLKPLEFDVGPYAGADNWMEQIKTVSSWMGSHQNADDSIKLNAYTYNSRVVLVASFIAQLLKCPEEFL